MTDVETLLAIEQIKRLKATYFYGLDLQDWDLWLRDVWAPDARLEVPEISMSVEGAENIVAAVRESTKGQITVHHGHMPIIDITSPDTATGIWAMEDRLYGAAPNLVLGQYTYVHGFGHYREEYVRLAQGWRIARTRLTRLRVAGAKVAELSGGL